MLTDAQRSLYYQAQGFSPAVIREIEEMRTNSPSRLVNQRGLKNTLVDFFSPKGLERRKLESYTVEFLYGLELEVFGDCHEYYVQVTPKNIIRDGRTSSASVDFMVLEPAGVHLVECKPTEHLEKLAERQPGSRGVRTPSETTLRNRLRRKDPLVRAYAEGGGRGFHAAEPASDPSVRSLRCLMPGLMVHVDSTKFDVRCSADLLGTFGFECPTLYVAMDSATGRPLGRSVLFGHSCRNALAVLIRDILHRQGWLPRYWIADGGSEYTGGWFQDFCNFCGATRIQPPPGAPRKNSLAENALGRINSELSHRFLGSTLPDQAGRSVVAKKKSYATACHTYSTIVDCLDHYLFEDLPSIAHGNDRHSAQERNDEIVDTFGNVGVVRIDSLDDFLIATSIPIERDLEVDPSRGVRYLQRIYTSADLVHQIRLHRGANRGGKLQSKVFRHEDVLGARRAEPRVVVGQGGREWS